MQSVTLRAIKTDIMIGGKRIMRAKPDKDGVLRGGHFRVPRSYADHLLATHAEGTFIEIIREKKDADSTKSEQKERSSVQGESGVDS